MLRFNVYPDRGSSKQPVLHQAHMLGADDRPVAGEVIASDGLIECRPASDSATALSLAYGVGDGGVLMLQTCLLEQREEPYELTLELARQRIKLFIAKCEEWALWDAEHTADAMQEWDAARTFFTHSMTATDPLEAERWSHKALIGAIDASERLAIGHGERIVARRFGRKGAAAGAFGVRIDPAADPAQMAPHLAELGLVVIPLRWRDIQPNEKTLDFAALDRWVDWAVAADKRILMGPLVDFASGGVPAWAEGRCTSYDGCREVLWSFMEPVVKRYGSKVPLWMVSSGLNTNQRFGFSLPQMVDLTRRASVLVRQARKGARTIVELIEPFGEGIAARRRAVSPMTFVDSLLQEGVRVDALGVQLRFGAREVGHCPRDLMQVSALLDRFQMVELPLVLTNCAVPSDCAKSGGGTWHGPWSPQVQADWVSALTTVALSKPLVDSIVWGQLQDVDGSPACGLVTAEREPKLALKTLSGILARLRTPPGNSKPAGEAAVTRPAEGVGRLP